MRADPAPFDFSGDERGVLCIHGFTGTPFEMRHLGRRLHQRGLTAVGPTLPGHGSNPADLDATGWRDWYESVVQAFDSLRERCDQVAVVGQSLGGLLALHLAAERGDEMLAVGSLAAPLWLGGLPSRVVRLTRAFPALAKLVPRLPKLGGSDAAHRKTRKQMPSYPVIPVRALHQVDEFMRIVRADLEEIRVPTVVVHAEQDHTAPFACAHEIVRRVSTDEVRFRALPRSFHLVACDLERDVVAAEVATFFESRFNRANRPNQR
jgi:carboxylesterase